MIIQQCIDRSHINVEILLQLSEIKQTSNIESLDIHTYIRRIEIYG